MICCMSAKHMEFAPRGSAVVQMRMAMAFCLNSWLSGYERLLLLGACEKLLVSRIPNERVGIDHARPGNNVWRASSSSASEDEAVLALEGSRSTVSLSCASSGKYNGIRALVHSTSLRLPWASRT